jgi:hypothetical protein
MRNPFAVALLAAIGVYPAHAHHSPASYDMSRELRLEGTIVSYAWRNPHSLIELETVAADGARTVTEIEAGPASILLPMGVKADSLSPGDRVTVLARPNRRGPGYMVLGVTATTAAGVALPLRLPPRAPPPSEDAPTATSIAGRWLGRPEDFFALRMAVLQTWALTDSARAALAATEAGGPTSRADCVAYGPPALHVEAVLTTIAVRGDAVVLTTDSDGNALERVVYLDMNVHPANLEPAFAGHSIGRWEGETLVVDTVGFAAHPSGLGFGVPSSARKHLTERFSLSGDRRQLVYESTITDPQSLAETVTFAARLDHRPDLEPAGSPCDVGVARQYLNQQ